jgi:hypothetical protein
MIVCFTALFGTLLVVYLFRGFGPNGEGLLYREPQRPVAQAYFKTPESAVKRINRLLSDSDWEQLAKFYDLEGSRIDRRELLDGSFFYDENRGGHGSGVDRYLHPFWPGSGLLEIRPSDVDDVFEVDVELKIDQGAGSEQSMIRTVYLRRYPEGYRLLPSRPEAERAFDQ